LLIVAWGPTGATRQWLGVLILAALLGFGLEVLRRQTVREFPEETAGSEGDGQLDGLERLARLRSSGALTESEFEAQKAALLHS
jgi:hypothetical protein